MAVFGVGPFGNKNLKNQSVRTPCRKGLRLATWAQIWHGMSAFGAGLFSARNAHREGAAKKNRKKAEMKRRMGRGTDTAKGEVDEK